MEGPFKIKFEDYFGLEHETIVWAQTAESAIRRFQSKCDYPVKIVSVELDYESILNTDWPTSKIYKT